MVHHAIVFTDPTGASHALAGKDGSYSCFGGPGFAPTGLLGGWSPGFTANIMPSTGMAATVRKGTDLVSQIHYHPSGKPEEDRSSVGLTFGSAPVVEGRPILVTSRAINIPAGEKNYVVKTSVTVPEDVQLLGITPHAHYLCKDMKIDATFPDGTKIPLIWIKDWDFNWQGQYRYKSPIKLPKGTRVSLEYTYDNSAENPRNPSSPPVRVHWGEQTTDEMALAFMGVALPSVDDEQRFQREMILQYVDQFLRDGQSPTDFPPEVPAAQRARLALAVGLFDRNHDGKLDAEERRSLLDFLRARMK